MLILLKSWKIQGFDELEFLMETDENNENNENNE
jgi:hypothetical protein